MHSNNPGAILPCVCVCAYRKYFSIQFCRRCPLMCVCTLFCRWKWLINKPVALRDRPLDNILYRHTLRQRPTTPNLQLCETIAQMLLTMFLSEYSSRDISYIGWRVGYGNFNSHGEKSMHSQSWLFAHRASRSAIVLLSICKRCNWLI